MIKHPSWDEFASLPGEAARQLQDRFEERKMWFNPIMTWLIRSPLNSFVGKNMLVIGYTGRKSGKHYETPVNYVRCGGDLLITSYRSRTWWRNLLGGAPVTVWLQGKPIQSSGEAYTDQVNVTRYLQDYLDQVPQQARYFNVTLDGQGHPIADQVAQAARERVMIRITFST